ncbi:uncharacterized protein [Rhodnius prolixus]|uniref:Putative juvenile hormone-inducible protein n=2 Tax=Rhodnius TaxID=13248 RepID=R4FLB9_RHOPR
MDSEHDVLKAVVNDGAFGPVTFVSSKLNNEVDLGTQFASVISFAVLVVNNGSSDLEIHVVLKRKHVSNETKDLFNSDVAFQNEVIMYTKILPLLQAERLNLFPKLFYPNHIDGTFFNENLLIFENLQHCGYIVTKEKIFIDYEHIKIALMKLAQFHGQSYLSKRRHKDLFFEIANKLVETKFTLERTSEDLNMFLQCLLRGIKPLIEQDKEVDILNKVFNKLQNIAEVAESLVKPEEPFSVICHGDFCRNNMFFMYDNDQPKDIKFFDLQNSLYSSPAIDISFFLYMNTTAEMRNKYWDDFLNIYWESLTDTVPNLEFTSAQFMEHFAKRAIYGYFPTSFFLPMSMEPDYLLDIEEFSKLQVEEKHKRMVNCAGVEGTKAVSDIVEHLLNKNYLHKFLEL